MSTEDCMYSTVYHFSQATVQMQPSYCGEVGAYSKTLVKNPSPDSCLDSFPTVTCTVLSTYISTTTLSDEEWQRWSTQQARAAVLTAFLELSVLVLSKWLYCAFLYTFFLVLSYTLFFLLVRKY